MVIEIKIKGINSTKKFMDIKKRRTKQNTISGLKKSAFFLQNEVKFSIAGRRTEKTSVDTGRFLNSVDFRVGKDDAIVFTDIPYSLFLELGTTRILPRRHFNNTAARSKDKVKTILAQDIRSI